MDKTHADSVCDQQREKPEDSRRAYSLLDRLGKILFPQHCLVCERPLSSNFICFQCTPPPVIHDPHTQCSRCAGPVLYQGTGTLCHYCVSHRAVFFRQRYLWPYQGAVRHLIVALKYRPSFRLTRYAAHLMAEAIPALFADTRQWDLIVPMPSTPRNYASRLFNPSRCLGEAISVAYAAPLEPRALRHLRTGLSQAAQNQHQRLRHARSSLRGTGINLRAKSVLLVDDVVTTGATSTVAADLLTRQGAGRVDLISLARAERWHPTAPLNKNHT